MSGYNYADQRDRLFTESGQVVLLRVRGRVDELLSVAGAFKLGKVLVDSSGDTFLMIACVDRLVEIDEIRELTPPDTHGQDRVFVRGHRL